MNWIYLVIAIIVIAVALYALKLFVERFKGEEEEKMPYRLKKYFFNRSEQEFLRILHEHIDHSRYLIFPKVRVADFVEVSVRGEAYGGWFNKIKSKHVDFLVWNVPENKVAYAIEVDGRSHKSERAQASDAFKDKLYETIGIPLERVTVGSDFAKEAERIVDLHEKLS